MGERLASIAVNLSRIASRAAAQNEPLTEELAREMHALCEVVRQLETRLHTIPGATKQTNTG